MIEKYIAALEANDYKALSELFYEKSKYFDYCATVPYHIYGKAAMEMFFRNKLVFRQFKIYDYVIESDNAANFMVSYNGKYVHARACIEKFAEDGTIAELIIRVA